MRVGGQQRPLAAPYAGPYQVIERGAKTFKIQIGSMTEVVSVDRLKAHTGPAPVAVAEATSRGRPKKKTATPSVQPAPS